MNALSSLPTYTSQAQGSKAELGASECFQGELMNLYHTDCDAFLTSNELLVMNNHYEFALSSFDEFNSFDYNNDSLHSRVELKHSMKCWPSWSITTIALLDLYMTIGDQNGDGNIKCAQWNTMKSLPRGIP
jgi:hypothetical protein